MLHRFDIYYFNVYKTFETHPWTLAPISQGKLGGLCIKPAQCQIFRSTGHSRDKSARWRWMCSAVGPILDPLVPLQSLPDECDFRLPYAKDGTCSTVHMEL